MTDYFALLGEARRAWLDPEKLRQKYFALSRAAAADAELNEAFRVLSDPKLRLHHLLTLEGADLTASRPSAAGGGGVVLEYRDALARSRAMAAQESPGRAERSRRARCSSSERTKLGGRGWKGWRSDSNALYETELAQLRQTDAASKSASPNELAQLVKLYDSISYLTRLREQIDGEEISSWLA